MGRGSLTARIKTYSKRFKVVRCFQGSSSAGIDELTLMGLRLREHAHVREVLLLANEVPVVFAHSVVRSRDMKGPWQSVGILGTRPLAEALFANPQVSRMEIEYRQIDDRHYLYNKMRKLDLDLPKRLWARRSLFILSECPLLVTEVFLPSILKLKHGDSKRS
jgi:chorismate--pyruvate lyase